MANKPLVTGQLLELSGVPSGLASSIQRKLKTRRKLTGEEMLHLAFFAMSDAGRRKKARP